MGQGGGNLTGADITIHTAFITLGDFLKWAGVADTGGMAKQLIAEGHVSVNGEKEQRRGRKLYSGDRVSVRGAGQFRVVSQASPPPGEGN